ncbi:hypothetical protein PENTCL1PPCAC_8436, partial [Pristionchus entomophagus]
SPKDYAMQLRQMKQKAKEDHQAGVSTVRVVEDAMKNAHPNVLPHVNPAGLAHAVQRYVQVPGMLEWPATIDPSQFNFRFLRQDNCDRFQRGEPTAFKLLFSEFEEGHLFTPCAYAFLTSKRTTAYEHVFRSLKAHGRIVNDPATVSCDFELALSKGFNKIFTTTKISRCAFHLYQAVYRKI